MKKIKPLKPKILKVRNKFNAADVYYTISNWPTKDIDGVTFLAVSKEHPDNQQTNPIHWMKKDNMEVVK